jgi:peptidoglycan/xylan/chitin deacetylase (PgdA/CDA1 family)
MEEYATRWKEVIDEPSDLKGVLRKNIRHMTLNTLAWMSNIGPRPFLRSLYCHYVFDDQIESFENLIIQLKKIGSFIDTDKCVGIAKGEIKLDNCNFHLSFDDGFRNISENALALLEKHQIPAIVFVPTAIIDAPSEAKETYCLETTRYRKNIEMQTWDDLRDWVSRGFQVGSHTRTHARFADISSDAERMYDELSGSKDDIEQKLGVECKYISWPYGTWEDADELSIQSTQDVGYEACFGAFRGAVVPGFQELYRIPRHHFEAQWPFAHVQYFALGCFRGRQ